MRGNPFQNKTVGQMLDETAARYPDREAVVFRDARITYREFQRHAERLARGLLALGIKKDDKVALWLTTRPAWLGCQYACAKIGATVVALNPRYKARVAPTPLAAGAQIGYTCTIRDVSWETHA